MKTNYSKQMQTYYNDMHDIKAAGGSTEGNTSHAFQSLLKEIGKEHNMVLIGESTEKTNKGTNIRYDAKLQRKGSVIPHGYWEAKDTKDDLFLEIDAKQKKGYAFSNIIFEDTVRFVLYQDGKEVLSGNLDNEIALYNALQLFFTYKNTDEQQFQTTLADFQNAIPELARDLQQDVHRLWRDDDTFRRNGQKLQLIFQQFNTDITVADIQDIIIQHTLTIDVFRAIYNIYDFEKFNPIAQWIDKHIVTLLNRNKRAIDTRIRVFLQSLETIINTGFITPADKQSILIVIYEDFYKAYNPKKADTHGIVYTPSAVVDFMVQSCDILMHKHFSCRIYDEGIRVLDPCVGTGTFITGIMRYLTPQQLRRKFCDLFAIEVDIMAYYMAVMNIEELYADKVKDDHRAYDGIALADTLEIPTVNNEQQQDMFTTYATMNEHNARIAHNITNNDFLLIIGNPPYNAHQKNENENNRNKRYPYIDKRIKETYSNNSNATNKNGLVDMYTRFMRWASDKALFQHTSEETRNDCNNDEYECNQKGALVSFITNRSYIDKFSTDGIRKTLQTEWDYIYIVDLGGDLRSTPKDIQTGRVKGNVFHIQTGVAIIFLVRKFSHTPAHEPCTAEIYYIALDDYMSAAEKLTWLRNKTIDNFYHDMTRILPDEKGNWLRQGEHDFAGFISIGDKATKAGKASPDTQSIFTLYSRGLMTSRDEWVYDFSRERLHNKMKHFIAEYEAKRVEFHQLPAETQVELKQKDNQKHLQDWLGTDIKWAEFLRNDFKRNKKIDYDAPKIISSLYRPFVKKYVYYDSESSVVEASYRTPDIFGATGTLENRCISNSGMASPKPFTIFITKYIQDLNGLGANASGVKLFPRYRYASHTRADIHAGRIPERIDNITDAALQQFIHCYNDSTISKDAIFYYVYAVLNHTAYTTRYADNLRQELPRIPYYTAFHELTTLGAKLATIHLDWEHAQSYPFTQHTPESCGKKAPPRTQYALRYNKQRMENGNVVDNPANNTITISNQLTLGEVPHACAQYTLGGRCAIDWVLEFYKESKNKPKDAAIQTLCHNGTLAYYDMDEMLPELLDTLGKVATVSVETMQILADIQAIKLVSM